jgi:hypothetical protein
MQKVVGLLGLAFLMLFTACSSGTSEIQQSLTGTWKEVASLASICDGAATSVSAITTKLSQSRNMLSGSIIFVNLYDGTEVTGEFQSTIHGDTVKGEVRFVDHYGNDRTYDVALKRLGDLLQGTFTDQLQQECPFGNFDRWMMEVSLLRKLTQPVSPDTKEPNENAEQAVTVKIGDSLELTLAESDVDWFTFDLIEASTVELKLELLTALNARVWLLKEGETTQSNKLASSFELTRSELGTQTNTGILKRQLASGKYHLVISGAKDEGVAGNHTENGKYKLTFVNSKVVPDVIYEPNDTAKQATKIEDAFSAELHHGYGDRDWFTFVLGQAKTLTFN